MAIPAGAQAAPTRAAIHSGTGHNVMYFKALAFCEADLPNTLTSTAKARNVSGLDDALLGYLRGCVAQPRSQWYNGSVLAFCEAVSLSAFVMRCLLTSEAAWDSRALNGDDQCWLSVRLLCQGASTAA